MIIRIWPRPMRFPSLMSARARIRKAGGQGEKNPESGLKTGAGKGVRVLDKAGERRRQMLAHWLKTRRVDSVKGKKKGPTGGAVAAGLAGGGKGLVTEFHVTADMTRKVYRDLKKPMASG